MSIFRPLIILKSDVVRDAGRYDFWWSCICRSWSPSIGEKGGLLRPCRQPRRASVRLRKNSAR
jgi:hypothetical protein